MVPELEKTAAVAVEKMKLEEAARRKLEERLITVSKATHTTDIITSTKVPL